MRFEEVLELDGFKVGDIVCAFHKGYHKIVKIHRRFEEEEDRRWSEEPFLGEKEISGLVTYTSLFSSKGTDWKRKENSCDIFGIHLAIPFIEQNIKDLQETREKILHLQKK